MERFVILCQSVALLCFFCLGQGNASPTLIPPPPPDSLELGGEELGYLLTMPQTLQAGATERFCLTLHGVTQDTTITLELRQDDGDVEVAYTHTYVRGESQCNTLTVPDTPGRYEVNLVSEEDVIASSEVQVLGNNLITFVQTDKPIYKPGQMVKFRILTMTRTLRSRVGEIETVYIKDPNDFNVKQYTNVESKGMASLEFQLINDAKLGKWTIVTTVDGDTTNQHFEVKEYVLPRFEVTVEPPPFFLITSETFNGTVCAKYTYGKPVKGFLTLQVCPSGYGAFDQPCAVRQIEIDGCHKFAINSSEILDTDRHFYGRTFSIRASVREMDTGVQVNGTASSPEVSYDPLKMEFVDDTNGYFKPGLPVHGKLKVSKPDGSPASAEPVKVTAQDHGNNIYLEKMFLTNDMGEIHYSICQGIMENTSSLSLFAEASNYKLSPEEEQGPASSHRLYTPTAHSSLRQWFSPSLSYVQIPAHPAALKCGDTLRLNVPFTHDGTKPYIKFHPQVMARGRIVHTDTITAPTMPRPMDILEVVVENCLEVGVATTYAPYVSTPTPSYEELNSTRGGEVAPPPPPGGPDPPVREASIMLPRATAKTEPEVYKEPEFVEMPEIPLIQPQIQPAIIMPLSEELDLSEMVDKEEEMEWEVRRKKRSIMPPFGIGDEEEIVRSESVSDEVSSVQLSLEVTPDMSPSFSVLLYYVRDDGEIVADSQEFTVQPCFENKVMMEFADETVAPGAETSIHLEAAAGSVCGIGVVDKSVNILGGDHQITPTQVFEKLKEYSMSNRNSYRYYLSDNNYCEERMKKKAEKDSPPAKEESEDEDEEPELERHYMDFWYRSNYVDAIEAFKQMGLLVMTNLNVETRPCSRDVPVYYDTALQPLAIGRGLPGPVPLPVHSLGPESAANTDVRTDFPETWLWDLHTVGESGSVDIPHTIPDTVTKWVGNSLCISEDAGFGLSPMTSITTFRPFFLAFNLPYNAVRGERLPITVTVYNYLDECLHMELMVDGKKDFKVHGARGIRDPFCLCGAQSMTKKFFITAQDIGKLPIFAQATIVPGQCGNSVEMDTKYIGQTDAVRRQVLVKAEGVTQRYSHSVYICPTADDMYRDNFKLPLPSDMVPQSARGDITVIGDIMGPALSNLDGLVRMPTGCGEQNMVGFTPNIYVLKYLTATGRLTELMQDKTKNYMEIGYQRELKYRHEDGSFSAYGPKGDRPGSTWLTAFVVKSFAQARPYIFIDQDDLQRSAEFLKRTQNIEEGPLNGCFFESGSVFSSYMQGGLGKDEGNDAALSAYVLIALLEAGLSPEDSVAMDALGCINRELTVTSDLDMYTLSLAAYVNTLYNATSPTTADIMNRLNSEATREGDVRYWKRAGQPPKPVTSWYYYSAPSAEVEMTSYALLATLNFHSENAVTDSQPIAFWLSRQQSAFGGFSSTQDTVLGLNALSEFAALAYSDEETNVEISVGILGGSGEDFEKIFMVTEDNALVLQRQPFDAAGNGSGTHLRLAATGTGCVLMQANVHYNKLPQRLGIDNPKFNLRVDPRQYQHDRNQCGRRTVHITYGQRNTEQFSTGMTMLTVRMVTGWSIIPESLRELRSRFSMLGIERYEVDEEEGLIHFYLDQLETRSRRFALDVEQDKTLRVSAPKPAEVQIYQYYEKDVTVVKSYQLKTTCGTKEELPYDQPFVDDGIIMQRRQPDPPLRLGASRGRAEQPSRQRNCPVCDLEKAPENYNEIVCNSTAVYKAHAGRSKKYTLKIKANLRLRKKVRNINTFANIRMEDGCQCALLQAPVKTVLIMTQRDNLRDKVLTVDARTHVFNLKKDRTLEKKARKAQRRCRMD